MTSKTSKTPKLFEVWVWYSNKTGWVHSSYILGRSKKAVLKNNPSYQNKHKYLICEA
jgi:hypothetical protein